MREKAGAGVRAVADLDIIHFDLLDLLAAARRTLRSLALHAGRGHATAATATTAVAALATHVVAAALARHHRPHLLLYHLTHHRTYLIAHR